MEARFGMVQNDYQIFTILACPVLHFLILYCLPVCVTAYLITQVEGKLDIQQDLYRSCFVHLIYFPVSPPDWLRKLGLAEENSPNSDATLARYVN